MANSFLRICSLPGAITIAAKPSLAILDLEKVKKCRYSDLKQMARDYMEAKTILVDKLVESGAGRWVEKPVEQDQFYIEQ